MLNTNYTNARMQTKDVSHRFAGGRAIRVQSKFPRGKGRTRITRIARMGVNCCCEAFVKLVRFVFSQIFRVVNVEHELPE